MEDIVTLKIAHLLLKLESIYNVPNKCIQELVEELQFISSSASVPIILNTVNSCLKKNNCTVEHSIVSDLIKQICESNPISSSLKPSGSLYTQYKRRKFFKKNFPIVEPVEYVLDEKARRTFQYVPILPSLLQILSKKELQEKLLFSSQASSQSVLSSFFDGTHFKDDEILSKDEQTLSLLLYVDDFEVCNPLGTSRKKHKITGVYWVLANLSPQFRATLTSIYLAVLCKAVDVKKYGYGAVLEPLLKDIVKLEEEGLFVPALGKKIKGTIFSVVADNLGSHSIGGFVECFSASHVCRFCLAHTADFQQQEVRTGSFEPRTKEKHCAHVVEALKNPSASHCFGVKKQCVLTEKLQYFHVLSGYPPDLLHDLFEGIVPHELALSLKVFIKKKYFSITELNEAIRKFPFKWCDKTNSPQQIPLNLSLQKSIGGNAHENWCMLRFLPFLIGAKVPAKEPAWNLLMDLKDIVELLVSPCLTEETIAFLDSKISEHRQRFQNIFPAERLLPKHHYLEHYPELIKAFGPPIALWTMRFEAKHRFFKRVVRQTNTFRNILQSLAVKHQLMLGYHFHGTDIFKPSLSVTSVTTVPLDVLKEDIKTAVLKKYPDETSVHLANAVSCYGTSFSVGMVLPYGSTGELPDFVEIRLMIIKNNKPAFIVKCLNAWYIEHLRSFELETTEKTLVLEYEELPDTYPLAAYRVGLKKMVTLKHHIVLAQ